VRRRRRRRRPVPAAAADRGLRARSGREPADCAAGGDP